MNLFTVAEKSLARLGEKEFLIFESGTWTNARLLSEAERLARLLLHQGLRPGDNVMLLLPNGPEIFLSFLALARLGCVTVPAGLRLTVPELSFVAHDSESLWVLTAQDLVTRVLESRPYSDQHIIDVGELLASNERGSALPAEGGQEKDLSYMI